MRRQLLLLAGLVCAAALFRSASATAKLTGSARKLRDFTVFLSPNGNSCNCPDGQSCWQCPGNLRICRNGQCQSGDVAEQCRSNSDCSAGLWCVRFKCVGAQVQTCQGPGADHCPCQYNWECASGWCSPYTNQCQTMPCTYQFQCDAVAPGTYCQGGYCWKPTWPVGPVWAAAQKAPPQVVDKTVPVPTPSPVMQFNKFPVPELMPVGGR